MTSAEKLAAFKSADRLWKLAEIAIEELKTISKLPAYAISMQAWHNGESYDRCHVCFAGCVIAGVMGARPDESWEPSDFNPDIQRRLETLNMFRQSDPMLEALHQSVRYFYHGEKRTECYERLVAGLAALPNLESLHYSELAEPILPHCAGDTHLEVMLAALEARLALCKALDL